MSAGWPTRADGDPSGQPSPRAGRTRIDHLTLGAHYYLTAEDECYLLREYTARRGFDASETNQIIGSIKKTPDCRGRPEWFYKERDLRRAASELRSALNPVWLRAATIVPVLLGRRVAAGLLARHPSRFHADQALSPRCDR